MIHKAPCLKTRHQASVYPRRQEESTSSETLHHAPSNYHNCWQSLEDAQDAILAAQRATSLSHESVFITWPCADLHDSLDENENLAGISSNQDLIPVTRGAHVYESLSSSCWHYSAGVSTSVVACSGSVSAPNCHPGVHLPPYNWPRGPRASNILP